MKMNEFDLLEVFHDEMKERGVGHHQVFLNLDEQMVELLRDPMGYDVTLPELEHLADICLANEWLERTTIDPHYNFLSLTEKGLNAVLLKEYK